jgi:hypothetical protein
MSHHYCARRAKLVLFVFVVCAANSTHAAERLSAKGASNYTNIEQVKYINKYIRQGWKDFEYTPSEYATEGEWCRRVFLDIIGRIPSVKELDAFVADKSPDKKAKLVDRLLSDDYIEEYARNWTTLWTNVLIGRSGGTDDDSLINREGMQQYLRRSFQRGKPYNKMVEELVGATGNNKPGKPGFNGAVNFLTEKLEEEAAQATARTSQVFMGIRVQCTQCHDHPFNNWKQDQFWTMNAFFKQTVALRRFEGGENVAHVELDNQDYQGPTSNPEEAEVFYELRNGELRAAYPKFIDKDGSEKKLPRSGFLEDVNRRQELAKLVSKSGYMPVAMVNRMWAHFLGFGFTKPFDDMGPHNPPSHPELLDKLGVDFKANGFDVKDLIRWITLSEAYLLSSRFNSGNAEDNPTLGNQPMFSRFYPRQMRAEELYESMLVATEAHKTRGSYEEQEAAKRKWLGQFIIAFGTDENDEASTFDGTIPQILMMFNGEIVKKATSTESGSFLYRVSKERTSATEKVNKLFKAALGRPATSTERKLANSALRGRSNVVEALQDMWWVLLNTNEFILNH